MLPYQGQLENKLYFIAPKSLVNAAQTFPLPVIQLSNFLEKQFVLVFHIVVKYWAPLSIVMKEADSIF